MQHMCWTKHVDIALFLVVLGIDDPLNSTHFKILI